MKKFANTGAKGEPIALHLLDHKSNHSLKALYLCLYLCSLLKPHLSSEFYATYTFTFVKDIQDADFNDMFMVSYDVASPFTNIPLSETVDLAVNAIFDNKTGLISP